MGRLLTLFLGLIAVLSAGFILSDSLQSQNKSIAAACTPQNLSGEFEPQTQAFWMGNQINVPQGPQLALNTRVLGATNEEKWIEIDLSDQTIQAHQGDKIVTESKVSSGKFNKTPTGTFQIWGKFKYTRMTGGQKGTGSYYDLPNVPYTMFFYNDQVPKSKGFGLHGTYWHNSFGQPMSHGCVNLPTAVAGELFDWTNPQLPYGKNSVLATPENPGTRIEIHE